MLPEQYPEVLAGIAGLALARAAGYLPVEQAELLAIGIAEDIRRAYPSMQIYIPRGDAYERAARNRAIRREFTGKNHARLAMKYRIGLSQVYKIVGAQISSGSQNE